jgi:Tol biopolymer transport system component
MRGSGYLPFVSAAAVLVLSAAELPAATGLQLVSGREPGVALPAGGNGGSAPLAMSPDGRYVLFTSGARDLVTNDNGLFGMNIFLRDRLAKTTTLVSVNLSGTGGGNGDSAAGAISSDGRYVVFESAASDLVAGDTNGVSDIFARDLESGTTVLVSAAPDGSPGNGASSSAVMTPDGRYVAFVSSATNLVAGDTNGIADVFVRDLTAGTTQLASVGATLPSGRTSVVMAAPVLTPDGRYVAFYSTAAGLAAGAPAVPAGEVYVRDLANGSTLWASTNAADIALTNLGLTGGVSCHPALSEDGRFVAFKTGAASGSGAAVVLRYDSTAGTTALIDTNGIPWGTSSLYDDVFGPEMTPDGRFIAFACIEGGTNTCIRLWDGQGAVETLVSGDATGVVPTNTASYAPALSPDGRFVAFLSNATNLTGNAVCAGYHVYVRDLQAGTRLVDADPNGAGSTDNAGTAFSLSTNGQFVAFCSADGSLVGGDNNRADDVFVRDLTGGNTELVSQREPSLIPQAGNSLCVLSQISMSADGLRTAFASFADDLVPGDTNAVPDIFVRDALAGKNLLVSAGTNGFPALGGSSSAPAISADGNFVVFVSSATNLVAGCSNGCDNIFLRDLRAGSTRVVSLGTNSLSCGDGDASAPTLSRDGRYVAFLSKAKNLAPGITVSGSNTFWCDTLSNLTVSLTSNSSSTLPPSMSADGRHVAFFGPASQLWVRDTQRGANIYTNTSIITSAALSPNGARLAYQTSGVIYVRDLTTNSTLFSCASTVPIRTAGPWSADGRFFVFVTGTALVSADTNGTNDIYLRDLLNNQSMLVSVNSGHTNSAKGPSDWPVISGDGRFVAYRSYASDIVPGNNNPSPDIFLFDSLTGSNSVVGATPPQTSWSYWTSRPAISGNGTVVAFESCRAGLVSGDLNRTPDVFASLLDSDGDGIPDEWMQHYFGHPTGQANDASRAQDDADGDGVTNLEEYLAGTDPTAAASFFKLQITPVSAGRTSLTWLAMPGRGYQVQYKDDLSDPFWQAAAGAPSFAGNQGAFTVPVSQPNRFYRIVLTNP